jgi:putative phosphoesterase
MKTAFISDIHGNATALEAVLEDINRKQVDKIIVLGDICYRGPEPKRALDLVRSLDAPVIKGNADEWVVRGIREGEVPDKALEMMRKEREWTVSKLNEDDINYLKDLPEDYSFELSDELEVHCFHAVPGNLFEVVRPEEEAGVIEQKLMVKTSASLYVYGHIHLPYVRFINGKTVANMGSTGLPFDGLNYASYLIAEADGGQFQTGIQRVSYDTEQAAEKYFEADYPNAEFMANVVRNGRL